MAALVSRSWAGCSRWSVPRRAPRCDRVGSAVGPSAGAIWCWWVPIEELVALPGRGVAVRVGTTSSRLHRGHHRGRGLGAASSCSVTRSWRWRCCRSTPGTTPTPAASARWCSSPRLPVRRSVGARRAVRRRQPADVVVDGVVRRGAASVLAGAGMALTPARPARRRSLPARRGCATSSRRSTPSASCTAVVCRRRAGRGDVQLLVAQACARASACNGVDRLAVAGRTASAS